MKAVRPFWYFGLVMISVILMGQACSGGGSPPPGTPPEEAAELETEARVRRELAVVWAGPGSSSVLPRLDSNRWVELPAKSLITTDANGEGWIEVSPGGV